MNLMYLSQDAINDVKVNFRKYESHFSDDKNTWFMDQFNKNGWISLSKIQCDDFQMDYDENYNASDRKNVEIIYENLMDLSPAIASDERLWAGVLFGQLWDYVKYRRKKELNFGNERDILNSFFFMRGTKRSCFMNCLSRLWWTGHLLYDKDNSYHYAAVDLICESAYSSNIVLISSNNFVSNKNIALGVLDCLRERKLKGEKIGRYHYVNANKYLNCLGAVELLDTMSREEVSVLVDKYLNKVMA